MTDRELMKMANRIEALAFEMKAPNAYTPQFVMLANEIRMRARLAQPEQEPVAWMVITMGEVTSMQPHMIAAEMLDGTHQLYTAPPQRDEAPAKAVEWQGLTQEDKREIIDETEPEDRGYVMALVEAKLKEKNHAI